MNWCRCMGVAAALGVVALGTAAQADVISHGGTTIIMDFVNVGNAGNVADDTGYGAVGYNYRIGKYEVTADQWAAVIAADSYVGNAGYWSGSQPTAGTSWTEAAKFCNWLTTGNAKEGVYNTRTWKAMDHQEAAKKYGTAYFLPTADEWYKAAYYDPNKDGAGVGGYWDYPTMMDYPGIPDGIDFEGDTDFEAVFRDGYDQGGPNSVYNAGVESAYGTIGQGGNVWEWNETITGSLRGLRGSSWYDNSSWLHASRSYYENPTTQNHLYGFRVASVPEPSSIWLILGGGLAGLCWWRRRR